MIRIINFQRTKRLIEESIKKLDLNLNDITILTEAASGNFIVTPIIAALAGAKIVYVVCRDSSYGSCSEVLEYLREFSDYCEIDDGTIQYVEDKQQVAASVSLVTNSGFVRPIDSDFISKLSEDAAISLMYESWEFRDKDIDLDSCKKNNIPILGVNENHSSLCIFRYVGICALKLLLERGIEVFKSKILLISSGYYMKEINHVLSSNGATVQQIDTYNKRTFLKHENLENYDAIIVAEQENSECLICDNSKYINEKQLISDVPIIHIAGVIDYQLLKKKRIYKYPEREVPYGYMTVSTDYVGVRPVIELNAAGLRVGQALVEGKRLFHDYLKAQEYALESRVAQEFSMK